MSMTFEAAVAAHLAEDFETAEQGYLAFGGTRNAQYNLGRLYRQTGRLAEAEACFRLILAKEPGFALAQRGLAQSLLAQRRYAEAWPLYEARRTIQGLADPLTDYPEWRGEDPAGRRIVVVGEEGHGDQIMFTRFAG